MRVIIGMSGGVDSSVAAYLLKKQGYEVVGVLFKNLPGRVSKCCNIDAVSIVGRSIGIPTYVIDIQEEFQKEIIQNFINQYKNGFTPNPCILCNERIKFGIGIDKAEAMFGPSLFATGHYAIIEEKNNNFHLKKGKDTLKDQSYFLWRIPRSKLSKIIFPLGNLTKDEVYKIASQMHIPHIERESQDICFIPGKIKDFLKQYIHKHKGKIVDINGKLLGKHNGTFLYTIGQRSGLGVAMGKPMYVIRIDAESNTIVLGERKDCFFKYAELMDTNFIESWDFKEKKLMGVMRYRAKESSCTLRMDQGKIIVQFDVPQFAMAPGQSLVLYDNDYVFGGGIIKKVH